MSTSPIAAPFSAQEPSMAPTLLRVNVEVLCDPTGHWKICLVTFLASPCPTLPCPLHFCHPGYSYLRAFVQVVGLDFPMFHLTFSLSSFMAWLKYHIPDYLFKNSIFLKLAIFLTKSTPSPTSLTPGNYHLLANYLLWLLIMSVSISPT